MKTLLTKTASALCLLMAFALCAFPLAAEADDDLFGGSDVWASDDDLFGGFEDITFSDDDELFSGADDGLFAGDDGIEVFDEAAVSGASTGGFSAGQGGIVFEAGSVRIGGTLSASVSSDMLLYKDGDDSSFGDRLYNAGIAPAVSGTLSVDARPTQNLRMYMKAALAYPFRSSASIPMGTTLVTNPITGQTVYPVAASVSDFLQVKEMFTDFSVADRAFFRFGLHTVSWGTGMFYSPVSDMINSGVIDPEDKDKQVDGSLNLRSQIIFPGTQNCLWLYAIPEFGAEAKARDTALAGKYEFIISAYEFGVGAFYKYQNAPKAMLTASGSIFDGKVSVFGEAVYQYGADSEWKADDSFSDKTSIMKATAGFSYYWKDPKIMLMGQYYYDGNNRDDMFNMTVPGMGTFRIPNLTYGHNAAFMANFGKIPGMPDFSATLIGIANFGHDDVPSTVLDILPAVGIPSSYLSSCTATATLNYSPNSDLSFGLGTTATWTDYDSKPEVSLKLSATLGGGKF